MSWWRPGICYLCLTPINSLRDIRRKNASGYEVHFFICGPCKNSHLEAEKKLGERFLPMIHQSLLPEMPRWQRRDYEVGWQQ
jgi:hypothetical protein